MSSAPWCGRPLPDDRDGWQTRAFAFKDALLEERQESGRLRESLAQIVGAFTSGVYCSNCGESADDCVCIIGQGRVALAKQQSPYR